MLFTEPPVIAKKNRLGFFVDFAQQQRTDLDYGGQAPLLRVIAKKPPEHRPPATVPAPPTPPTR
ncbi:MAG: hypothetical protein JXR83_10955 [Deltaproteobacteria bacterium]|nr:hypothetical protein [Deltaproteobacteria bacterium]